MRIPKRVTILSKGDRALRIVLSIFLISMCVWMLTAVVPWESLVSYVGVLPYFFGIAAGLVGVFNPTLDYITFYDDDIAVYIMLEKYKHFCYEQIALVKIANASRGRLELGELVDDIRIYSHKNEMLFEFSYNQEAIDLIQKKSNCIVIDDRKPPVDPFRYLRRKRPKSGSEGDKE